MAQSTDALVRLSDTDLTVADPQLDIRGRKVLDRNGDELGHVDALLIDQPERKVRFLEVASGGFLGMGERKILLPVNAVTRVDSGAVHVDTTRQHVAGAPAYDPSLAYDRSYYGGIYGYYGLPPYWSAGDLYPPFPLFQIAMPAPPVNLPADEVTIYEAKTGDDRSETSANRSAAAPPAHAATRATEKAAAADAAAIGSLIPDANSNAVLDKIWNGMRVVAANGDDVGKVEFVKMGAPDAATVSPASVPQTGFWGNLFGEEGEPDIPEPLRDRLLRDGFIKVNGPGWFGADRYVTPDQIASVNADTVTLRVDKRKLASEQ